MTALDHPETIRHFQSICDALQELTSLGHNRTELRIYADGYLHAVRKTGRLERHELRRLEQIIDRWILDPSSFIGPGEDISSLFNKKEVGW